MEDLDTDRQGTIDCRIRIRKIPKSVRIFLQDMGVYDFVSLVVDGWKIAGVF
jgi:hypothetical protein